MPKTKYNQQNIYSVSQNFLTNKRLIERLIRISAIIKDDIVIEIGTGKGHLTRAVSNRCRKIYSVEIDERLYHQSQVKLAELKNVKLINQDFLKFQLPKGERYKVFSNIPFCITSNILKKLTNTPNPPTDIWITLEKGTAKRFLGIPRESQMSLLIKPFWDITVVYYFNRDDFHPRPSVDVVFVHFCRKHLPDIDNKDFYNYQKFIKNSLKIGLSKKSSLLSKRQVSMALKHASLPCIPPSGSILYVQWLCLFRYYMNLIK